MFFFRRDTYFLARTLRRVRSTADKSEVLKEPGYMSGATSILKILLAHRWPPELQLRSVVEFFHKENKTLSDVNRFWQMKSFRGCWTKFVPCGSVSPKRKSDRQEKEEWNTLNHFNRKNSFPGFLSNKGGRDIYKLCGFGEERMEAKAVQHLSFFLLALFFSQCNLHIRQLRLQPTVKDVMEPDQKWYTHTAFST